jgi:hypothetical protein
MHHNHVGQLIWCLNNKVYERNRTSYCHKPVVQRWTTPSSWRWWWCWHRGGWRKDQGWLRQRFPLQSLLEQPLFCVSCFSAAPDCDRRWGLYIGIFRSSWASGDEDGWHRRLEAQTGMGGAAWPRAHATCARLASGPRLIDFFSSRCFLW